MQPTIAEQYNEVRTLITDALIPNGFGCKAEDYVPSGTNGNASLTILMTGPKGRQVRVSITDTTTELQNSCQRTFRLTYEAGYADVITESGEVILGRRNTGRRVEELGAHERCKYNAGQFLASPRGLEILRNTRTELESRFAKLDLVERSAELVTSAQRILRADKTQHGTLLDSAERDALNKWLSQQSKVTEDKLQAWTTKGEKLQKRPLSNLSEQSKDAAAQGSATPAQLKQLAEKFAPQHRRAS